MKRTNLRSLTLAALFCALTCVATLIVIPLPMLNGYANLGDSLVLLGAFLLGPLYGAAAGGIGAALADLLLGYGVYAPATLILKALMAFLAAHIVRAVRAKGAIPLAAAAAELVMMLGYFLYEFAVLGYGAAAAVNLTGNGLQAVFGVICSTVLYHALAHLPVVKRLTQAS